MQFAKRMDRLGIENAFMVLAQVTKLKEEGKDIINFGVGVVKRGTKPRKNDEGGGGGGAGGGGAGDE